MTSVFWGMIMRRKRWFYIIVSIICLLLIINGTVSYILFNMVIKRGPKDFLQDNADLEVAEETLEVFLNGDWRDWRQEQEFEQLFMESFDGLTLTGYYLPAVEETNKTVVFAHGYLGHAFDMALFGEYYYEQLGFNMFT